jgi:hypothetical protein
VRNGVVGLEGRASVGGRPLQNTTTIMVGASQDGLESHLKELRIAPGRVSYFLEPDRRVFSTEV